MTSMSPKLKRTLVRAGAGLALALVLIWLMRSLESVTTMLMVALLIAYLLNPAVQRFERLGLGRSTAAFLPILLVLTGVAAFLLIVVPAALSELARFAGAAPKYVAALHGFALQAAERFNIQIPHDWNEFYGLIADRWRQYLPGVADSAARLVSSVFKSALEALSVLFYGVMCPVIAYYLLVSFDGFKEGVVDLIPRYARAPVIEKLSEMDGILAAFIRGQLTVATILGILYAAGFLIIGIDLALVLGLLSGLLWIIPYVGTLFALVSGSLMALAKFGDLVHVAYVIGWIGMVQVLEGYVLTPRIVGTAVGLHPVVYILTLIVGANLFGFVGMLVAIPVTAVLKVLLRTGLEAYRDSYLYSEPSGDQPEP